MVGKPTLQSYAIQNLDSVLVTPCGRLARQSGWVCVLIAIVVQLTFGMCLEACAQETESNSNSSTRAFPDVMSDLTLPVAAELYMPDEEGGKPIFLPNVTAQELQQYRAQQSGMAGVPFQYQSITVNAEVTNEIAELSGRFEISLGPKVERANIPLYFGTCQLGVDRHQIESQGTYSHFYADSSGYHWTLLSTTDDQQPAGTGQTGEANKVELARHAITLTGKSRITRDADRYSLRISLPTHPCRLSIQLPSNATDERVRNEDVLVREKNDRGILLTIDSRGGDFTLFWRSRQAIKRVASVEAQSQTTFEIVDLQQPWKATTNLSVRWYGNDASDQFRLRLPAGARWRTTPQPDFGRYGISVVDGPEIQSEANTNNRAADSRPADNAQELPVELLVRNFEPAENQSIDLLLEWEWSPQGEPDDAFAITTAIPAPFVSNVSLHRGTVECVYPSIYSVAFTEGATTQLIQQGRVADSFGSSRRQQFSFRKQPFDLQARFRLEQSLPTIRPTYQIAVDENKLVMTAWLDCSFDVNQHRLDVDVNFGDWILQENTAKALASRDDLFSNDGDVLRVRLKDDGSYVVTGTDPDPSSYATGRRVDQVWRLVAERSWTPDENNELEFRVPEIIRRSATGQSQRDHGSGSLIVTGTDNILLQWQETASTGLLSDSFSTENEKYVDRKSIRKPLAYRFQSRGTTPRWNGRAELLPQALTAEEKIDIQVLEQQVAVNQVFDLKVANVPLTGLSVAVSEEACTVEPQFYLDGILTYAQQVSTILPENRLPGNRTIGDDSGSHERDEATWYVYQLIGAPALMGNSKLTIMTVVDTPRGLATMPTLPQGSETDAPEAVPPKSQITKILVPLARPLLPTTTRVTRTDFQVRSTAQVLAYQPAASQDGSPTPISSSRQLPASVDHVLLQIQSQDRNETNSALRVGLSWLQTAIDGSQRRDRFVAKIETETDNLAVRLPKQAYARNPSPQVLVDGILLKQPDAVYDPSSDSLIVQLPGDVGTPHHTLEIFYSVRTNLSVWSTIEVSAPQILGAEYAGRFYWQLASPRTDHLCQSPATLTSDWHWEWGGIFWFRNSARDERTLIAMLDATDLEQLPASANQYLMSGKYPTAPFRVHVVSRFIFWFPIGSLAIAIVALLINRPVLRKPLYGAVLALLISTCAMVYPDLGVLLGQTAVASLGLVAMVLTTQAAIESRVRRRSVFSSRPSTYVDGSDHFTLARSVRVAEPSTTLRTGSSVAAGGDKP